MNPLGGLGVAALTWGTTADERELPFPCDALQPDARLVCWRGIDVDAPPSVAFRWLCQLRVAPYSYDWIDNLGRRSPARFLPGLDELAVGQPFMRIFDLASFERFEHLTLRLARGKRALGDGAVTYRILPGRSDGCRLLVKLRWDPPLVPMTAAALADLVMMRRQLMTLKRLAEGTPITVRPGTADDRDWVGHAAREAMGSERQAVSHRGLFDVTECPTLIAEDRNGPVGFLAWDVTDGTCETLALGCTERRRGAGTLLLEAVADLARDRRCGRLVVVTTAQNTVARRLYERSGYALADVRPGAVDECRARFKPDIPPELHDEVVYERALR